MEIEEAVIRVLLATGLGALIGLEREYRNKSAGFRTMIMISLGSALFTVISLSLFTEYPTSDPTRIISYVIGGVGFLGAGAILKDGATVRGLTTSSTIWLVAALGIGAGSGQFAITIYATVIALIALIILPIIEHTIDRQSEYRRFELILKSIDIVDDITHELLVHDLEIIKITHSKSTHGPKVTITTHGKPVSHEEVAKKLVKNPKVVSF